MRIKHFSFILALLALMILSACRSSKEMEKTSATPLANKAEAASSFGKKVLANQLLTPALSARLSVGLNLNGKNISCNGRLQMKRGELVRISLTLPIIGTEVGRIECTPKEVLIINRFNKEYVQGTYADVPFLATAGLDFYALEALFWHDLFVPRSKTVLPQLHRFTLSENDGIAVLSLTDAPNLIYDFHSTTSSALLQRTAVRSKNPAEKNAFTFFYDQFTQVANRPFPARMAMVVKYGTKNLGMTLELSRFSTETDFDLHTEVSSKYSRRSIEEIAKQLSSLNF